MLILNVPHVYHFVMHAKMINLALNALKHIRFQKTNVSRVARRVNSCLNHKDAKIVINHVKIAMDPKKQM